MLKIAICDDQNEICSQLERVLLEHTSIEKSVEVFYSGENLVAYLENNPQFDLIFLDIELGEFNGINVGEAIRNKLNDHICKIVFITSKDGYEKELFDLQPFNFLRKPINEVKLIQSVELVAKILNIENNLFEYKKGHNHKKIPIKEILYFESVLKKIKIVSFNQTTSQAQEDSYYASLEKVKVNLPNTFFFPHRSYLVNYNNVKYMSNEQITMLDGSVIPISRRYLKNTLNFQVDFERSMDNGRF